MGLLLYISTVRDAAVEWEQTQTFHLNLCFPYQSLLMNSLWFGWPCNLCEKQCERKYSDCSCWVWAERPILCNSRSRRFQVSLFVLAYQGFVNTEDVSSRDLKCVRHVMCVMSPIIIEIASEFSHPLTLDSGWHIRNTEGRGLCWNVSTLIEETQQLTVEEHFRTCISFQLFKHLKDFFEELSKLTRSISIS